MPVDLPDTLAEENEELTDNAMKGGEGTTETRNETQSVAKLNDACLKLLYTVYDLILYKKELQKMRYQIEELNISSYYRTA